MTDFATFKTHLQEVKSYAEPSLECDLVLKGGLTSGVVYPLAICELARTYRFRSLGGTSAGAIAAALAAAAEKGRLSGGFARLAGIPGELSEKARGKTKLLRLFQPQTATRHLFGFLIGALEALRPTPRTGLLRTAELGLGLLGRGWLAYASRPLRFVLTLLGAVLIAGFVFSGSFIPIWLRIPAGLFVLLLLELLFLLCFLGWDVFRAIPKNFYGLCTGMESETSSHPEPALTTWLADLLDEVSGISDHPLTFGDLWGSSDATATREIDLRVMTTSLTHGRPYTIPFEVQDLYFNPDELRAFFPERIVVWLVAHARVSQTAHRVALYALPNPGDLPVIVAVRLSLSFPLLISAAKLYTVDHSLPKDQRVPEPCWFSDGGITSNFPVHFFDAPIPRRPTFAINLRPFRTSSDQSSEETKNVFLPTDSHQGRFLMLQKIGSLGSFLSQLFSTLQNWSDNTLVPLEGFRERIVHVHLSSSEGGANLNMDAAILNRLTERGWCAGKTLVDKFAANHAEAFNVHRQTRFVLSLAAMQLWLEQFSTRYDADFKRLVLEHHTQTAATDIALEGVDAISQVATDWKGVRFEVKELARLRSEREKQLEMELRIRPRL
jgi:predicted acylesterase/phospholipase RssA